MKEFPEMLEKYCPMLGHHIPFSYCLSPGTTLPCLKLRSCWSGRQNLDIDRILKEMLPTEELKEYNESHQVPKITSIFSILEKYRKEN